MNSDYPYLEVTSPDQQETFLINFHDFCPLQAGETIKVGRFESNQIVLPDPKKKISRIQCQFTYNQCRWWIIDEGSANGTYVQRPGQETEIDVREKGRLALAEGDVILILGDWYGEDTPLFWHLIWHDPGISEFQAGFEGDYLEYSFAQQNLWHVKRGNRELIPLSPQQLALVTCLAKRTFENQGQATACSTQELLKGVWEEPFGHTLNDVNRLVWSVRHKIEVDAGEPRWLKTAKVKGGGYSLQVKFSE